MHARIALATAVLTLALVPAAVEAQEMKLTPELGLGTLPQATADQAFEAQTLGRLQDLKDTSGFTGELFLLRKDRGPHAGQYAVLATAPAGSGRGIAAVAQPFPSVTTYSLVGAGTIGPLPTVDILGVHYIKVQPDKAAAFDTFVSDKLNPAVANLRPDLRFLYYKSQDGGYITVIAITKASRDKYWPGGADSDDLKTAFTPAVKALASELQTYLVPGTWGEGMTAQVYEAKEWADWAVVVPGGR